MKFPIITNKGENTGREATLTDAIFEAPPHQHLMHRAVVNMRNRQRQGTASTKARGEVQASTRKLAPQKGRGRARVGSASAGSRRGGGACFGPRPHGYDAKMNKREKPRAAESAFAVKHAERQLSFMEQFQFEAPATSKYVDMIKQLGFANERVLWVTLDTFRNLVLSARNVPKNKVARVDQLNTYDLLHATRVIILEEALPAIQKKFA
ncbi:MAG: 50S ribosomal protein L4 [Cytophagales bacterium]